MGFGLTEILIVVIVILLLFGPNKLPAIVKSFGAGIRGFKQGLNDSPVEYRDLSETSEDERRK